MQLGYLVPAPLLDPLELADTAILADELGYDAVFITDQFQPWRQVGHAPSVVPWLSFVGARTSRISLGVNSFSAALRRHPATVAQDFATLGCLLPGRVTLSLGVGAGHDEVAATGKRWPSARRRLARLREAVTIIRALWAGERLSFRGEYFRTKNALLHDLPAAPVPLLVNAGTTGEAEIAGTLADGAVVTSGAGLDHLDRVLVPAVRKAAKGRPEVGITVEARVSYDVNPRRAAKSAKLWMPADILDPPDPMSPRLFELGAADRPTDVVAPEWIVGSTPDVVVPRLRRLAGLGVQRMLFTSPSNNQERFLKRFASEVIPALRD